VLAVWLVAIVCIGRMVAPGLSRVSYPQPVDLLVLALIPVGAFHATKHDRTKVLFLTYGCLASTVFAFNFTVGQGRIGLTLMYHPEQGILRVLIACAVVVAFGLGCRAVPSARGRLEKWRRFVPGHCQKCGYNLTGNVSGVCPECGEKATPQQSA
jgi:hypothetical protein